MADIVQDIEEMSLLDSSVDLIFCSHVLEHVDDRSALSEMFRVLRPNGVAVIMVPIVEGWKQTYEPAAIVSDEQRLLHFGQSDHVRYYGADLRDRITAQGFSISEFTAVEPEVSRYGLVRGEKVFLARKQL